MPDRPVVIVGPSGKASVRSGRVSSNVRPQNRPAFHIPRFAMPKLDVTRWGDFPAKVSQYTGQSNGPYSEVVLGEQANLSQFGVHIERLPPGSRSSFRHWHETEDEFVYVVEGEVVLVESKETLLCSGEAAAWKAGTPEGHCLENRSARTATLLVVGTRAARGVVHYSDYDVVMHHDESGRKFFHKDGTPWSAA